MAFVRSIVPTWPIYKPDNAKSLPTSPAASGTVRPVTKPDLWFGNAGLHIAKNYAAPILQPTPRFGQAKFDYNDDSMRDIWLGNDPRHTEQWLQANKDADRLLAMAQEKGLDTGPVAFLVSSAVKMLMVAARGLPKTLPGIINGLNMFDLIESESKGMGHIDELVINTIPRLPYLLNSNTPVETKLVIAHVYGHCDFFGRNKNFAHTRPEQILSIVNGHCKEAEDYIQDPTIPRIPGDTSNPVKKFLNSLNSLDRLIDWDAEIPPFEDFSISEYVPPPAPATPLKQLPKLSYEDRFLYPAEEWEQMVQRHEEALKPKPPRFPANGAEFDILGFIAKHSPVLPAWQRRLIQMKREQAYYFLPQMKTKIMNEGYASFWHNYLVINDPELTLDELKEFGDTNDAVLRKSKQLNPYWLGFKIYENIYIKAGLGISNDEPLPWEYQNQTIHTVRLLPAFDEKAALKAIFDVTRDEDDQSFIRKYLTPDLVDTLFIGKLPEDMKTYGDEFDEAYKQAIDNTKQGILEGMKRQQPELAVVDGNFDNKGELLINHSYTVDILNPDETKDTMKILAGMWGKPVHVDSYAPNKSNPDDLIAIRYTATPDSDDVKVVRRNGRKATATPVTFNEKGQV